jgi:hypothetical protein
VVVGDNRVVRVSAEGLIPEAFQVGGGVPTSPLLDELTVDRDGVAWCWWDQEGGYCLPDFPHHCFQWSDLRVVRVDRAGGYLPTWLPPGRVVHTRSLVNNLKSIGSRASGTGITFGFQFEDPSASFGFVSAGLCRVDADGATSFLPTFGSAFIFAVAYYDGSPTAGDFVQFGASSGSSLMKYDSSGPLWSQPWSYPAPSAFSWNPDGVVADGKGGAFTRTVVYSGSEVGQRRLNHVLAAGVSDASWPAAGASLDGAGAQLQAEMSSVLDGRGGCFLVWADARSGVDADIYGLRFGPDASTPLSWALSGHPIAALAGSDQAHPTLLGDDENVFVGWVDTRDGGSNLFIQKFGFQSVVAVRVQRVTAELVAGRVELAWELDEPPGADVVVERCSGEPSAPAAVWSTLGGLGAGSAARTWRFVDADPAPTTLNTYRLHDRRTAWTGGEVSIELPYGGELQLAKLSPNPIRGVPQLTIRGHTLSPIELTATDAQSRVHLKRQCILPNTGSMTITWDELSHLPSGLYWLTARQGDISKAVRFVVTH